jgi:hypothetical protein
MHQEPSDPYSVGQSGSKESRSTPAGNIHFKLEFVFRYRRFQRIGGILCSIVHASSTYLAKRLSATLGDLATYLVVFAMLAWPMSFCSLHASMPPLA